MVSEKKARRIVILFIFLTMALAGGAFYLAVKWARSIEGDSLWAAVSPSSVGDAIQEMEHGTPWRAVPFCWSFDAREAGKIDEASACKALDASVPKSSLCGVQGQIQSGTESEAQAVLLARSLSKLAADRQCTDLVLDLEPSQDVKQGLFQSWLSVFAKELRKAPSSARLVLAVKPTSSDQWKPLCESMDELLILAYGRHMPGKGERGEMAPVDWVQKIIEEAKTGCPLEKLRIGLAAYGYNWKTGALVPENQAGMPQTTDDYIETNKKRAEKITLAHQLGIHKFFLWALGMEH